MTATKKQRCWPGYEPVPGKPQHSQGSCRPKAKAKLTASEKQFRAKRKRQLSEWQKSHPGSRKSAAQHLSAPDSSQRRAAKKTATRKSSKRPQSKRGSSAQRGSSSRSRRPAASKRRAAGRPSRGRSAPRSS